jgi:tetratricopeptide (TPR) repeat protein
MLRHRHIASRLLLSAARMAHLRECPLHVARRQHLRPERVHDAFNHANPHRSDAELHSKPGRQRRHASFATRSLAVVLSAVLSAVALFAAATGAHAGAQAQSRSRITFNHDVAPILYARCASCHRPGASAPFSLLTFDDARQRARLIATAVSAHVMPPWQPESAVGTFVGERRLTGEEIDTLVRWVADGVQEGDQGERPLPPVFTSDWQLGTPDLVVTMPAGFTVPADGPDVFRNFVLPIPLAERRFVRALEFRPGNPRVVHHVRMLLDDSGELRRRDLADSLPGFGGMDAPGARFPDGHFLGWAPGKMPAREAYPWPLEPGNDLVIQMHLKPTGRPEAVAASVGLYLTDTPPSTTPLLVRLGSKTIDIPASETRYDVIDRFTFPVDVTAVSIYPHAHYLATEMVVTARRPDGRSQTLLRIPDWNFNWQDEYSYATPVVLPKGTTLEMRYRYDNSAVNPHNPSAPPRRVRFGSDTRDEMGELLVQVIPRTPDDATVLRAAMARKNLLTDIAGEEKRIADVPDDAETRNALGVAYAQLGRVADAVTQIEASLRTNPELAMAHYNLGVIAMNERRLPEAIARFERAIAAQPEYPEAHNNLGIVYEASGQPMAAEPHYRAALVSRPNHVAAHNNLGRVLLSRGAVAEALDEFRRAVRVRPDNADVRYNLGRALVANRQPKDAVREWRRSLALRPDSLVVTLDLAALLATNSEVMNAAEAVGLAERASKSAKSENPAALDVLAIAYAADGRLELAARTAQIALTRALVEKNDALAAEIRGRLAIYEQASRGRADSSGNP